MVSTAYGDVRIVYPIVAMHRFVFILFCPSIGRKLDDEDSKHIYFDCCVKHDRIQMTKSIFRISQANVKTYFDIQCSPSQSFSPAYANEWLMQRYEHHS